MQLTTHRNRGALVGAVVGGAVGGFVVIVIAILLLLVRRRRRRCRAHIDHELDRTAVQPFGESSPHPILLLVQFLNPLPAVSASRNRPAMLEKAKQAPCVTRAEPRAAGKHAENVPTDVAENLVAEHEDLRQQIAAAHASQSIVDEGLNTTQGQVGEGYINGADPPLPVTGSARPLGPSNVTFSREVATLRAELARLRAEGIATLAVGPPPAYG